MVVTDLQRISAGKEIMANYDWGLPDEGEVVEIFECGTSQWSDIVG